MTRLAVVVGVLVVAGSLAMPVGAHTPPPPPVPFDSPDRIEVTYGVRIGEDPTALVVRASVDVPSSVEAIALEPPPGAAVVNAQGFEDEGGVYVADGDVTPATLSYRVGPDTPGLWMNASDADPWAVFERGALRESLAVNPEPGRDPIVRHRVHGWGIAPTFPGTTLSLLGTYTVVDSAESGEHRFRVVVPEGTSMAADPDAVLASLAFAREHFDGGHRHDDVVGFAVDAPAGTDGLVPRGYPEFAVDADAPASGVDDAWVHRYVHTRQNFSTTPDLRWIYEGSAAYETALLSLQRGTASWTAFRETATTGRYADVDLTDPEAEGFRAAAGTKGAAIVAVLDERIRRATEGEETFDAVLRRMNHREDSIDTAEFEAIVEDVTAEPDSGEVGWMVDDPFDPEPPADPGLFADRPDADPDGDGLQNAAEVETGTNPFVVDTDGDGAGDGAAVDRESNPRATGGASNAGEPTSTATPPATDPGGPTATSASTADAVSPVRIGAFVAWLALLGAAVWVVRRR